MDASRRSRGPFAKRGRAMDVSHRSLAPLAGRGCPTGRVRGGLRAHSLLPVPHEDLVSRTERPREPLHQVDRSMTATRATDGDGQVIAVVARVIGQPAADEVVD